MHNTNTTQQAEAAADQVFADLKKSGIHRELMNTKIYSPAEFVEETRGRISEDVAQQVTAHRLYIQPYFDGLAVQPECPKILKAWKGQQETA